MKSMHFSFGHAHGGDTGVFTTSLHIGFGPRSATAVTALSQTLGDAVGQRQILIDHFTTREPGHTIDKTVPCPIQDDYPYAGKSAVSDSHMTGVTAALYCGPDLAITGTLMVWFFD